MTITTRRRLMAVGLALAVSLGTGCNILSLPFFLLGPEPKKEAGLKRVASDSKDKIVKLVLVTYSGLETRPELIQADRQLTELLAKHLHDLFEYNKERVVVVSPRKVEEFKSNNPNWHQDLDPGHIGRHFGADYVAYLEINNLTLYEKGSVNQMYRGRADITVTLVDVHKHEDYPEVKEFTHTFPGEAKGPIPVSDMTLSQFRQLFFDAVARRLSWYFTAHPMDRDFEMD